ncbi:MAG TPA: AAA family ATPase [Bacteroidia bacterium]|jgi:predicted ATPase|nr:AAA family ATPase [Bacteroidia bacterium]
MRNDKRISLPKETCGEMITKLKLKNFLSYKEVTINFKEFNVIVGANASGKTNLSKALITLRSLILGGFNSLEDFDAFMEGHFHRNSPDSEPMIFEIEVENPTSIELRDKRKIQFTKHIYLLQLEYSKGVTKEHYYAFEKGSKTPYNILVRTESEVKFSHNYNPEKPLDEVIESNLLSQVKFHPLVGKSVSPFLMMMTQAFCNHLYFYSLSPTTIINPSISRNQKVVSINGSNLAGVLQYYKEHNPVVVDSINEILKRNIPNFVSVGTKALGANNSYLFYVEEADSKQYMLNELSDGTDVYIAMVTAMVASQYLDIPEHFRGIMIIEEPERNLHPQLMEELMDLAKSLTDKFQIITTTHSSDIVAHLLPEDLILLDKSVHGTRAKRVSESKELDKYLDEFSLDQIWLNNDLKGGTIDG